jgi:hypothetical protein
MKHIKLSLIDTDQTVQAMTDLNINDKEVKHFSKFVEQLKEELVTGQTAFLEIEGVLNKPVVISLAEPM